MPAIFVDTAHHIAVFNANHPLHGTATLLANELSADSSVSFVTTHLVLAEFLASTSRATQLRVAAAEYVSLLISQRNVTLVDLTGLLFERALELYRDRSDKSYSLTDCVSMIICRDLGITQVLTSDHDFEQEGLAILLRAPA